jgi:GNAT superfamily N-acetyltransferase
VESIELREAVPSDAPALGSLHVASWHETYAGLIPGEMLAALSVETQGAMWRDILAEPGAYGGAAVFVAEEGGRPIGFGACGRQRDETLAEAGYGGEIGAVYVLRSHQQRGVGRAIMAALSRALSERRHDAASVWVLRENAAARAFYEALGGEIVGEKSEATLVELAYGWQDLTLMRRSGT